MGDGSSLPGCNPTLLASDGENGDLTALPMCSDLRRCNATAPAILAAAVSSMRSTWRSCWPSGAPSPAATPAAPASGRCETPCPPDFDGDGAVGILDMLTLLAKWGPRDPPCPPACLDDLDGNCTVNVLDLLILLANWG